VAFSTSKTRAIAPKVIGSTVRHWVPFISSLLQLLCWTTPVPAQTGSLSLSPGSSLPGGTAVVNLSLSGGSGPASLQWTVTYAVTDIASVMMTAGQALVAAGKSLSCAAAPGAYTCLAWGLNTTAIGDGVVATASIAVTLASGSTNVGIRSPAGALPSGDSLTVSGTSDSITVTPTIGLKSLGCSPTSIVTPGSANCTVTLSAPAPAGGVAVPLSSSASSLTVPEAVTVAAGSTSASFTATAASVTMSQIATVTTTWGGGSQSANITLTVPLAGPTLLITSLACSPSSLAPGGASTCTVILNDPAPSGGAAVTLTSSSPALTLPAALTVPAGSTSARFAAVEGSVTAAQNAMVTVALGTSSLTNTVVLNPAGGPPVLKVGPEQTYSTPCQALTAAADGAIVQIDARGSYLGDVCMVLANNLTIRGVNGRPKIDAAGLNAEGKGTWVFEGNNITVDTVELTGGTVPAPNDNGAGIRMEGNNLTVLSSYIHDNQEGVLVNANPNTQILIQSTEFNHNGFGDGLTHNIHIQAAARLTLQYSYSHNGNAGHLVETGAAENFILYNRLTSENGTTSFELNINNGGRTFVLGNLIEKGFNDQAGGMLGYLLAGTTAGNSSTELYVVNNTFVNDQVAAAQFLEISAKDPTPAAVTNNIFCGPGNISTQSISVLNTNLTSNPLFVNKTGYDYHLTSASPAINTGSTPATADGVALMPVYEYLDPTCAETRTLVGTIDIGAYEFSGAGAALACGQGLSSISLNPNTVTGGASTSANTVTLSNPAPSAGASITLTSSNPSVASVPATVTVPGGATSASFGITTSPVTGATGVIVSSAYSGATQTAMLNVVAPVTVASVQCSPTSLTSGTTSTCTVTIREPAPAGGVSVAVSVNSSLLTTPASVSVAAGATSATFSAVAGTITSSQGVTVSATLGGISKSVTINLTAGVSLSLLACSPTSLASGATGTCTVTLSAAAPPGGTSVALSDNSPLLTLPVSVTVPAGSVSATLTVSTGTIVTNQNVLVIATLGSISKSMTLNLTGPVNLSALTCNATSLPSHASTTCTLTLTNPAPSGGVVVALSDAPKLLNTPSSVTLAAGSTSANFIVGTQSIRHTASATLTARLGTISKSVIVLVVP
jgi:hypothetical protein